MLSIKENKSKKLEAALAEQLERDLDAQIENEDELFVLADYDETAGEKTGYSNYSYWRSTVQVFLKNKVAVFLLLVLAMLLAFTFIQPLLPGQYPANLINNNPQTGKQLSNVAPSFSTVIATALVFMFGEMTPKSLANDRGDTMALFCAPPLRFLMKVLRPLVIVLSAFSKFASKLFRSKEEPTYTEEELVSIIETAKEEGVVDEEQRDLLKSALEFTDKQVSDVMTVRTDICAVDLSQSNEQILKKLMEYNYSRVPAYIGKLDNLVGILNARKFMIAYAKNPKFDVKPLVARPYPVRGNAKISDLLTFMRQRKIYMAVVTDEKKHIVGIVTIEDFLEELVGEIWDEDDEYDDAFLKTGGNHFVVSVKLTIGETFDRMGLPCQNDSFRKKPLLAWLFEVFGRMPREEETFTFGALSVTIDSVDETGHPEKVEIYAETNGADTLPSVTGYESATIVTAESFDEQEDDASDDASVKEVT